MSDGGGNLADRRDWFQSIADRRLAADLLLSCSKESLSAYRSSLPTSRGRCTLLLRSSLARQHD
jgi:hypothetical protein